jgi:fucose permease
MATYILVIIYMAFISLGLPDSLLGVTWPIMRLDLEASLGSAGIISMVISGGTIVSSFMSGRVLKRFGTGKVTAVSVLMTACALLGISFTPMFLWLIVLAIPLGLGAGAVDAGLNAYIANHYKSYHMSWLHCFWGVGAMTGPIIMSQFIKGESSWRKGYLIVAAIQFVLVIILIFALPLWDKSRQTGNSDQGNNEKELDIKEAKPEDAKNRSPIRIKGVKPVLLIFLLYCATESTLGLWGSSFLVNTKELSVSLAAQWVAMYYGGITLGRFLSGFLTLKLNNRTLIRLGQIILLIGALLFILPFSDYLSLAGFVLAGLGCAPIYPCMLHETPVRFGKENSQSLMGIQMAIAYTGSTFLPPVFGFIASSTTMAIFPMVIIAYALIMLICSEKINLFFKKKEIVQ